MLRQSWWFAQPDKHTEKNTNVIESFARKQTNQPGLCTAKE